MGEMKSRMQVSRRQFVGLGAALGATLGLTGCSNSLNPASESVVSEVSERVEEEGTWVPALCWMDCGGRCVNKQLVVDGVVVRQKSDDSHPDSPDFPQQRSCLKGRCNSRYVFGPDRLRYPMKRKNWEPNGGGDRTLRGRDEWERISWDEAIELVASEIKRVVDTYGNNSVVVTDCFQSTANSVMNLLGGSSACMMVASAGAWQSGAAECGSVGGFLGGADTFDRMQLRKCKTIVLWGTNPAVASGGNPAYFAKAAKDAGAKFIGIDPNYNETFAMLDAQWIPIRPGTDIAMMLAVADTLITEDDPDTNPLINWDFLEKCTVGFDADHMPANATANENFRDYVLGKYDGVEKTAEWAEEICGVPADTIREFARAIGCENAVALLSSYAPARTCNADDWPQLFMTIGCMTGHWGREGHCTGLSNHVWGMNEGLDMLSYGNADVNTCSGYISGPLPAWEYSTMPVEKRNTIDNKELWNNAVPNGKYNFYGPIYGFTATLLPHEERQIDVRMIYSTFNEFLGTFTNSSKAVDGLRNYNIETVIRQDVVFSPAAQYSDIVLPAITPWERGGGTPSGYRFFNHESLFYSFPVCEPLYEAKSDEWIAKQIAVKLGFDEDAIFPLTDKEMEYIYLSGAVQMNRASEVEGPLITFTQEDIDEYATDNLKAYVKANPDCGVTLEPQQGVFNLYDVRKNGVCQFERTPDDEWNYVRDEEFVANPEKNPLPTASGKLEIYCEAKADIDSRPGYTVVKPYPTYVTPVSGYAATFSDWDNKVKGDYPFQVMNQHYMGRYHMNTDQVDWLREAYQHRGLISTQDAAELGIEDGDTTEVSNQYGTTLIRATVTDRIMPGVINIPHGAWLNFDDKEGVDRGGHDNWITPMQATGQGHDPYNSAIAAVRKYTGSNPLVNREDTPIKTIFADVEE